MCNREGVGTVYPVTMRTIRITTFLCLALLGVGGCTSEEDREKARLTAEIEEGLVEYRRLLERSNELKVALDPNWPGAPDSTTKAYQHFLSSDPDTRLIEAHVQQLRGQLENMRGWIARDEERLAKREAGEQDSTGAAVRRLYDLEWSRTDTE